MHLVHTTQCPKLHKRDCLFASIDNEWFLLGPNGHGMDDDAQVWFLEGRPESRITVFYKQSFLLARALSDAMRCWKLPRKTGEMTKGIID